MFPTCDPRAFFIRLQELAHQGDRHATVIWPLAHLGIYHQSHTTCWEDKWLDRVARAMRQSRSWLKMCFPSKGLSHNERTVYPQSGWPDPSGLEGIQPWERNVYRYPEARGLQSMSVLLSMYLKRLKRILRGKVNPGLLMCLEDIREELYREQSVVSLTPFPLGSLEDPAVRNEHWKLAENSLRKFEEVLGEDEVQEILLRDLDCDGHKEIWLCTNWGRLNIIPHHGGKIQNLNLPGIGNISNTLSRHKMDWHHQIPSDPSLPILVDSEEGYQHRDEDFPIQSRRFYEGYAIDSYHRALFVDHLFDRRLHLGNIRNGLMPEFLKTVSHQLIRSECADGKIKVEMAASCIIQTLHGERSLAIQKLYTIHQNQALIEVLYTFHNRSLEPINLQFGTELNFNVDGKLDPQQCFVLEPHPVRSNFLKSGARESFHGAFWNLGEVHIQLQLWSKAAAYYYPVETPVVRPDGLQMCFQGHCLLSVWDLSLWSDERVEYGLSLSMKKMD